MRFAKTAKGKKNQKIKDYHYKRVLFKTKIIGKIATPEKGQ